MFERFLILQSSIILKEFLQPQIFYSGSSYSSSEQRGWVRGGLKVYKPPPRIKSLNRFLYLNKTLLQGTNFPKYISKMKQHPTVASWYAQKNLDRLNWP